MSLMVLNIKTLDANPTEKLNYKKLDYSISMNMLLKMICL